MDYKGSTFCRLTAQSITTFSITIVIICKKKLRNVKIGEHVTKLCTYQKHKEAEPGKRF